MVKYYILSCLLGIFIKIYDDFTDLKLKIQNIKPFLEFSKIIIIICTFLLIQNDYIFCVIVFLSLLISNYCKKFDKTFWYAYTFFVFCCCVFFYDKTIIHNLFSYNLLFILYIPISIYIEETTHIEEISKNKMISRRYGIIQNFIIILLLEYYDIIQKKNLYFFVQLILFVNSYFITNIVIQLIYMSQYTKKQQKVKQKKAKQQKVKQKKAKQQKKVKQKSKKHIKHNPRFI